MNTGAGKPAILVYGNCQGERIAHIARFVPTLTEYYDIRIIEFQYVRDQDWETKYTPEWFADVRVLWNQVESGDPTPHRKTLLSRLPDSCQIVAFPPLSVLCMWPFSGSDPRAARFPETNYPWPDSLAASLYDEANLPDEDLFEKYMALSSAKMPDLGRRLRLDGNRARITDELSDIKMWDWVESKFRTQRLFHSSSHLTALPLAHLLKELIARTGGLDAADIARCRRQIDFLSQHHRGQDIEVVPIHPLVAERLELSWYDPNELHRWHGHRWSYREYILKYIRWEPYLN